MNDSGGAHEDRGQQIIGEQRAKQGRQGLHVFVILATSLALAAIAALFLGAI